MPSFILNDESKLNSYGFRTANAGIDLERFRGNSVMLDSHAGWSTASVIGKWTNIRIEGSCLMADDDFDPEDETAQKIKGKVDRGYLKGVSMGLGYNKAYMELQPDGTYLLTKSELLEASIVSIPSNANALKLYAETGELLDEKEIRLSLQEITNPIIQMNKIQLSVATVLALGLQNTEDLSAVAQAVEKTVSENADLKAQLSAANTAKEAAVNALKTINDAKALALVDKAVADGKILADKKEHFLTMAKNDFATTEGVLEAIPAKAQLGATTTRTPGNETGAVKTDEDFQKLSHAEQVAFKAENPEAYAKLFA